MLVLSNDRNSALNNFKYGRKRTIINEAKNVKTLAFPFVKLKSNNGCGEARMGYHYRIQMTLDHIEAHLGEQLTLNGLAALAGFSDYHYHRVFLMMVGDPVMEYVRKRRLARSAIELAGTGRNVVDIALDHGFQTHETFTRAFKRMYGMTPVEYRRREIRTPPYPQANVIRRMYNPYLGGIRMNHRMVSKPAFKLIGYELRTSSVDGLNLHEIPAFWQQYLKNEGWRRIPNVIRRDSPVELGICTDMSMENGSFSYLIGMEVEYFENVPEDLVCREFEGAEYAVFTTSRVRPESFSASIQDTWRAVFEEWFPHSEYEHAGTADFEWYDERSNLEVDGLQEMDIYIPVKRKSV